MIGSIKHMHLACIKVYTVILIMTLVCNIIAQNLFFTFISTLAFVGQRKSAQELGFVTIIHASTILYCLSFFISLPLHSCTIQHRFAKPAHL